MRTKLLATAAVLGLLTAPAFAQDTSGPVAVPGEAPSQGTNPATSTPASGTTGGDNGPMGTSAQQAPMNESGSGSGSVGATGGSNMEETGSAMPRHGTSATGTGTGGGEPTSTRASNITEQDTRSTIAPRLPTPPLGPNASAADYLRQAQSALQRNRTGEAQEALERAETRALDRASSQGGGSGQPANTPMIQQIRDARMALGHNDRQRALQLVDSAMSGSGNVAQGGSTPGGYGQTGGSGSGGSAPGSSPQMGTDTGTGTGTGTGSATSGTAGGSSGTGGAATGAGLAGSSGKNGIPFGGSVGTTGESGSSGASGSSGDSMGSSSGTSSVSGGSNASGGTTSPAVGSETGSGNEPQPNAPNAVQPQPSSGQQ